MGNITSSGGVTVNGGTLAVNKLSGNGNVAVNAGGTLKLNASGGAPAASLFGATANTLTVNATGKLDVNNAGIVLDYDATSPETSIRALLVSGHTGNWTGNGINSSAAAAGTTHAVGYLTSAEAPASLGGVLLGQAFDATAVLVRYTRVGDTNIDGIVDFDDLLSLAQNYGTVDTATWIKGDSNYDGAVNFDDLLGLAQNYGTSAVLSGDSFSSEFVSDWALAQSMVPEPATLSLVALGSTLGIRRRRR